MASRPLTAGETCNPVSSSALSLRQNFIWTLGGNVISAGAQWAIIVLLAKIMNAETVGRFAFANALTYPIALIANLKLRDIFITDLDRKYGFEEIVGLRYILSVAAFMTTLSICWFTRANLETTLVAMFMSVAQLVDCVSENYWGIMQRYERMDRIARSLVFRGLLSLAFFAAILYGTHSLVWGVLGLVFGRLTVLLVYDAAPQTFSIAGWGSAVPWTVLPSDTLWRRLGPKWNIRRQWQVFWVALPLGIVTILVSIHGNIPRYVIEHHLGPRELGIYSALSYLPQACFMVTMALSAAAFAKLSRLFFAGDLRGFRSLLLRISAVCMGFGAAGTLVILFFGHQLVSMFYRPEYAEHVDVLFWLMAVGVVQCVTSCLGCALTAAAQFRVQVPLFAIAAATSLGACMLLIPRIGLVGAAAATLISVVVQLILSGLLIWRAMANRTRALASSRSAVLQETVEASA